MYREGKINLAGWYQYILFKIRFTDGETLSGIILRFRFHTAALPCHCHSYLAAYFLASKMNKIVLLDVFDTY